MMELNDSATPQKDRNGDLPPDLDLTTFLNADPKPTFILEVSHREPLPFDMLFCNDAIRRESELQAQICGLNREALIFRAWAQATTHWRQPYEFAGRSWTAFRIGGKWKALRALVSVPIIVLPENAAEEPEEAFKRPGIEAARLDSMLRMMDLSEVGTFEVDTHGSMLWNNVMLPFVYPPQKQLDPWRKLSLRIQTTLLATTECSVKKLTIIRTPGIGKALILGMLLHTGTTPGLIAFIRLMFRT
jgi:hypothetical protein